MSERFVAAEAGSMKHTASALASASAMMRMIVVSSILLCKKWLSNDVTLGTSQKYECEALHSHRDSWRRPVRPIRGPSVPHPELSQGVTGRAVFDGILSI